MNIDIHARWIEEAPLCAAYECQTVLLRNRCRAIIFVGYFRQTTEVVRKRQQQSKPQISLIILVFCKSGDLGTETLPIIFGSASGVIWASNPESSSNILMSCKCDDLGTKS